VWIARAVGKLRDACIAGNVHPFVFDNLQGIVKWATFEPDWDHLCSILSRVGLSPVALEKARATSCEGDLKTSILECDGMDAVRVLAAATRFFRPRGISPSREIRPEDLMAVLRVAFDPRDLEDDEMFSSMRRWERRNPRYPLLRRWRTLDPLGQVWDQRYWETDLGWMLRCLAPTELLAAFKMDLDNFKPVNETLGHSSGDEALRLYCAIIMRILGSAGEVYRRGGDEVVALVPGLDAAAARAIAEKVRATIEGEFLKWAKDRQLESFPTASIGLVLGDRTHSGGEIVRAMDEAEQKAKRDGKNRVVFVQLPAAPGPR
jgi:diguanylate cyclase (GGDEF)-like protein